MLAFELTVDTAEEFWRRVIEQKAESPKERQAILLQMAEEGLVTRVTATNRTKEEYINDLSKHYKILNLKSGEHI